MGRRDEGLTLVELVVAVAVFGLGLAALMPMVVGTVRANDVAAVRSRAVALAQEKVEDFRALQYEEVLAVAAGAETLGGIYTRSWQPLAVPALAGDGNDLRRLAVTVSWNLPGRGAGGVTLLTARARY